MENLGNVLRVDIAYVDTPVSRIHICVWGALHTHGEFVPLRELTHVGLRGLSFPVKQFDHFVPQLAGQFVNNYREYSTFEQLSILNKLNEKFQSFWSTFQAECSSMSTVRYIHRDELLP